LTPINTIWFFVFQGIESQNFSLVVANTDSCRPATPRDCITVAINKMVELEFVNKPVYSLLLEVEVRHNYLTYTVKVKTGLGSSAGIATGYRLDGPGIETRWGRDFSHASRPALGHTQPPLQWVPGLSRG
jgi:hypothetical protein